MRADPSKAALGGLFDRARRHIPYEALPRLVMNDPGHEAYVRAYRRVLEGGVQSLFEETGQGLPLIGSFEITENLLISHATASESVTHRWFSTLTACIELLGAAEYRSASFPRTLAALLREGFALSAAGVPEAPLDLLPLLCRGLQQTRADRHEVALALVAELLTAALSAAEVERKCRTLHAYHDGFQQWYSEEGERDESYAARPEFLWGAVVTRGDLPTWLALTEQHFPSSPSFARETRERLLREGDVLLRAG